MKQGFTLLMFLIAASSFAFVAVTGNFQYMWLVMAFMVMTFISAVISGKLYNIYRKGRFERVARKLNLSHLERINDKFDYFESGSTMLSNKFRGKRRFSFMIFDMKTCDDTGKYSTVQEETCMVIETGKKIPDMTITSGRKLLSVLISATGGEEKSLDISQKLFIKGDEAKLKEIMVGKVGKLEKIKGNFCLEVKDGKILFFRLNVLASDIVSFIDDAEDAASILIDNNI